MKYPLTKNKKNKGQDEKKQSHIEDFRKDNLEMMYG